MRNISITPWHFPERQRGRYNTPQWFSAAAAAASLKSHQHFGLGCYIPTVHLKNEEVQSKNFKRVNIFSLISEICNVSKISQQHRVNFLPLTQNVVSNLAVNSDYLSRFISKRKSEPQLYAHRISNVFFLFIFLHSLHSHGSPAKLLIPDPWSPSHCKFSSSTSDWVLITWSGKLLTSGGGVKTSAKDGQK